METSEILLKQTKAKAYCYAIKYLESVIHQRKRKTRLKRYKNATRFRKKTRWG